MFILLIKKHLNSNDRLWNTTVILYLQKKIIQNNTVTNTFQN